MENPDDFYFSVYRNDIDLSVPFGRIQERCSLRSQWKGTDVCMDIFCVCGASSHIDADFFSERAERSRSSFFTCWSCKQNFAVGEMVTLIPLTAEQSEYVVKAHVGFTRERGDLAPTMHAPEGEPA